MAKYRLYLSKKCGKNIFCTRPQKKVHVIMHFFEKLTLQEEITRKPLFHLLFIDVCRLLMQATEKILLSRGMKS